MRITNQRKERKMKRRPGIVSNTKSSRHKRSKNYKKRYRGQGKTR